MLEILGEKGRCVSGWRVRVRDIKIGDLPIGFEEVGTQVDIEKVRVGCETFEVFREGEDVNAFSVLNRRTGGDGNHVTEADAEIVPDHTIATDLDVLTVVISEDDANGIATFLALEQDSITAEEA